MTESPDYIFHGVYFSYGQLFVHDGQEENPECDWTDLHFAQGFARRASTACFGTLLEHGHADLSVFIQKPFSASSWLRAISVPFFCRSGSIIVRGPDEHDVHRSFLVSTGHYRLIVAQSLGFHCDSEKIAIHCHLLSEPTTQSEIIVADDLLDPVWPLVETAEIP